MKTSRNWKFDYIKGIACLIVVCLHCPLYGPIGDGIIYACRFSVPLFFMITGYYCESKSNEWILRKTKELIIKTLIAEAFYGVWKMFLALALDKKSLSEFILNTAIVKKPLKLLFFGSMFNGVLWYLYAAIWAYLLIILLRKAKLIYKDAVCYILIIVTVCILVIGRFVAQNLWDEAFMTEWACLFCNALIFGLPMLLTGMLFSRHEEAIKASLSLKKNVLILAAGLAVMGEEFFLSRQYMDFHFSTYIISLAIFLFAFTYKKDSIVLKEKLSFVGQRLSLWIYLDHVFVNSVLFTIERLLDIVDNLIVAIVHPIVVIILSFVIALAIDRVKSKNMKRKPADRN